jgi:hypothetical protein
MALAEKLHEGMRKHIEKTKGKSEKKGDPSQKEVNKTGNVSHWEIHPANGGHILTTHMEDKNTMGHNVGMYPEPKKSVHKSLTSAHKQMKSECGCGICAGGETDSGKVMGGGKGPGSEEEDDQ